MGWAIRGATGAMSGFYGGHGRRSSADVHARPARVPGHDRDDVAAACGLRRTVAPSSEDRLPYVMVNGQVPMLERTALADVGRSSVDAGDWIAAVGVVVVLVGAAIAVSQAVIAKRQAVSAQEAATAARDQAAAAWQQARSSAQSAEAALRQASAAEEQLELMRGQAESAAAEALEAAAPVFQLYDAKLVFTGEWYMIATLCLTRGPALTSVTATVRGDEVRWIRRWIDDRGDWLDDEQRVAAPPKQREWTHLAAGALLEVVAEMEYHVSQPANLTIDLRCLEDGGEAREWTRTVTASASQDNTERSAAGW